MSYQPKEGSGNEKSPFVCTACKFNPEKSKKSGEGVPAPDARRSLTKETVQYKTIDKILTKDIAKNSRNRLNCLRNRLS